MPPLLHCCLIHQIQQKLCTKSLFDKGLQEPFLGVESLQAGGHWSKSSTAQSKNLVFLTENEVFVFLYQSQLLQLCLPASIIRLGQPCLVCIVSALFVTKQGGFWIGEPAYLYGI